MSLLTESEAFSRSQIMLPPTVYFFTLFIACNMWYFMSPVNLHGIIRL